MSENIKGNSSRGFIGIVALLIVSSLVAVITFTLSENILAKKQISTDLLRSTQSYYSSEAGIEDAILRKLKNYNLSAINSFTIDGMAVDQNITQNGNTTTINSSSSNVSNVRKLASKLTITTDNISFYYGVQVGEGGLTMSNNSTIIGNLYSDGTVNGSSAAKITGDVFVATGMALDHSWTVYNADRVFGDANPVIDVAQSFVPNTPGNLSQVAFYIKKIGNPGDKTIRIVADNAGSPSKTELASTTLVASKVGTIYEWVNYAFSAPSSLIAGTRYWIIIDTSQNSSKYFSIGKDSNNGNGNGVSKYSPDWNAASPVWTQDSGDFNFKIWIGGQLTSLNDVVVGGDAHANTITNSNICGNAYYQTIDANSTNFLNNPTSPTCGVPLTAGTAYPNSPDPAVQAMPISSGNIADWEADALAGGIFSDAAHCQPTVDISIGPAKLACDFTPAGGVKITLNGTVWVEGDINLSNNAILELASGYGANSGIIIADKPGSETTSGVINISNNVVICGSSGYNSGTNTCNASNGSYILILSTHSGATNAINIANNTEGAIFYAANGIASVSNNANLKEVTAYKLQLANNASVTYESGLASVSFSSGPGAGWMITSWNETQ